MRSSHLSNERKSRLVSNDPPTHLHTRLFPRRVHNGKAYVNSSLQEEHFSLSLSPSTLLRLPFVAFSLLTNNQEGTFGRSHINLVNSLDSVLVRISSIAKRLVAFFPTYEMKSPEGNLRVLLRPVSYNEVQPMCSVVSPSLTCESLVLVRLVPKEKGKSFASTMFLPALRSHQHSGTSNLGIWSDARRSSLNWPPVLA